MNKKDSIARKILGWETNNCNSWYDCEHDVFVNESYFLPEKYMEHAMVIVNKLESLGFQYTSNGVSEVHFNNITGVGNTLPEAITNAAYSLIENNYMQKYI